MLTKLIEIAAGLGDLAAFVLVLLGLMARDAARRAGALKTAGFLMLASGFVLMGAGVVDHANLYMILFGAGLTIPGHLLRRWRPEAA